MTSKLVIRNYFLIAGLYTFSASLIWGVNTLFLLDAGLDIFGVFITNAVFTAAMTLFEIPTGVLADSKGRRVSFLLSLAVLTVGTLGYVGVAKYDGGLGWFNVMSVILGLGFTFYSGAVEAWLVDALNATGYEGQLDIVFSRAGLITGAAMLGGTVLGGVLGNIDLSIPFVIRSVLLVILFWVAYLGMHELGYEPISISSGDFTKAMKNQAMTSIKYGWNNQSMRLIIFAGVVQNSVIAWAWYAWQPHFLNLLGQDEIWVLGIIAALISLSIMVGNSIVGWFTKYCGRRTTLLLWASSLFSIGLVGVGFAENFWLAVGMFLVVGLSLGLNQPVRQAFIHRSIPSETRATIVSFDSMISSGGSVLGQSGLGYISQVRSIGAGYSISSLISIIAFPLWILLRKRSDAADVIEGVNAGELSSCAAQGLPQVSSVDASINQGALAKGD